jgi:hypothetical protein
MAVEDVSAGVSVPEAVTVTEVTVVSSASVEAAVTASVAAGSFFVILLFLLFVPLQPHAGANSRKAVIVAVMREKSFIYFSLC